MNKDAVKRVIGRLAAVLALAGLTVYTIYHFFNAYTADVDMAITGYMSLSESVCFDRAYLFRREEVVTTSGQGEISYLVGDGERVSLHTPLARVYEAPYPNDMDVRAAIAMLDREIAVLKSSKTPAVPVASDIERVEEALTYDYERIRQELSAGNVKGALTTAEDFRIQLNRMDAYAGGKVDYAARIAALEAQREELYACYTGAYETLTNERSGYFYYDTDGYESLLDAADIPTLTIDGFYDRIEQVEAAYRETPYDPSGTAGKMMYDFTWYLALPLSREQAEIFAGGGVYEITFFTGGGMSFDMPLYDLLQSETDERAVAIFSCTHIPQGISLGRMQQVRIEVGKRTGYGVPSTALEIVNGFPGVYIFDNGKATFRKITILAQKNGYYLVEPKDSEEESYEEYLHLNDCVIVSGRNLYEGKVVGY